MVSGLAEGRSLVATVAVGAELVEGVSVLVGGVVVVELPQAARAIATRAGRSQEIGRGLPRPERARITAGG